MHLQLQISFEALGLDVWGSWVTKTQKGEAFFEKAIGSCIGGFNKKSSKETRQ